MMIVVCTGDTDTGTMKDALFSIRKPILVATMEVLWYMTAERMRLPRAFWSDKLQMMRFVLRNDNRAIMLGVDKDGNPETWEMIASFHAMGVDVWKVMHSEEAGHE